MLGNMLILLAVIFFVLALVAKIKKKEVASVKPEESQKLMMGAAVVLAVGIWLAVDTGPSHGNAITEVMAAIPDSEETVHHFLTGELSEGVAVVINQTAGFWVKDGKVFAVNGVAKNMASGVDYAPADVTWLKVEESVE